MAIRAMRYPQRLGAPDREPAGLRGTNPRLAARYWGLSVPDYIERADVWRLDPPNGNLLPWLLIESPLGVANVREIARQLSERNIGAVLFAGSETGGDIADHARRQPGSRGASHRYCARRREGVRPPRGHDEHGQHDGAHRAGSAPVHGRCDARAAEGSGPLGRRLAEPNNGPPRVRHGAVACQGRNRDGRDRTGPARRTGACRRRSCRRRQLRRPVCGERGWRRRGRRSVGLRDVGSLRRCRRTWTATVGQAGRRWGANSAPARRRTGCRGLARPFDTTDGMESDHARNVGAYSRSARRAQGACTYP